MAARAAKANGQLVHRPGVGIEGAHQTPPDLTSLQPVIDVAISGNQVFVDWGWGGNRAYLEHLRIAGEPQRRQGLWAAGL